MAFGGRREWWSLEAVAPAVLLATASGDGDPDPQDLEYVSQIKRVLELLKKNRDMLFNEVKLIIVIEDPRDVERKRLLGIDDETAPTRDDLADALVQVNEGQIPENRLALQMLAEELLQWPYLEDDESLRRWKEKLLGSVDINSAGGTVQGLVRMDVIHEVKMSRPAPLEVLDHVKINVDPDTPVSTLTNVIKSSKIDLSFSKDELRKAEDKLRQAFIEFYRQLRLLKSYCFLNMLAFSKIMKKYDKITSDEVCSVNFVLIKSSKIDLSFSKGELRKAEDKLRQAFIEFYRQLRLLKSYCFLNMLAFSKIMKKYDKSTSASKAYLEMVEKSYLGSSDEVNKLIERLEATFIKHFCNGNHRKGMKSLKSNRLGFREVNNGVNCKEGRWWLVHCSFSGGELVRVLGLRSSWYSRG
ncbi:hypothetical protein CASFOL_033616 [Castilleja foliolosa]|uniref:SPX domain-containing protein n=1 Tax=Castilleja foliolosa TaxID=1961234 RepID=A0ABD3BXF7_9LAMI